MPMEIPFVDLRAQHSNLREEIRLAIDKVIETGDFILGEEVTRFEQDFAAYLNVRHVIGTGNGLDALRLAMIALNIGDHDEVIVPANTYIATALAVSAVGAHPILVEPDENTFNLDVSLVERAITSRTKAILVVHLYGQPADMDDLLEIANEHKLLLLEDACQSHGAKYKGKRSGTFGDAGCFSFYPSKNLGAMGDAGAVVTAKPELSEKLGQLRNYGKEMKYSNVKKGFNSRLDNIQAAVLNVKLKHLDLWNQQRMQHANRYSQLLAGIPQVKTPKTAANRDHVFHLYVVRCEERDRLHSFLASRGIATQIHYPVPIHLQQAYADLGFRPGAYPLTERISTEILSLPMYPELQPKQIEYIVDAISDFYSHQVDCLTN